MYIYELTKDKFFSGKLIELSSDGIIPTGWTKVEPPGYPAMFDGARWNKGSILFTLDDDKEAALLSIDRDTDAIYRNVVGDKQSEYEAAEAQARAYKASEWAAEPGQLVAVWASVKGWTNQQAAEDIIAEADKWRAAQVFIRHTRLTAKEAIRNAETQETLNTALSNWNGFMKTVYSLFD